MNSAPTPDAAYWREVQCCHDQLYRCSERQMIAPGLISADIGWVDPEDPISLTQWQGRRFLGLVCVRADLIMIRGQDQNVDYDKQTATGLARHFRYSPGFVSGPRLRRYTFMPYLELNDPDSIDAAAQGSRDSVKRQRQLGLYYPEPSDYEDFLNELRRGASGEHIIYPSKPA